MPKFKVKDLKPNLLLILIVAALTWARLAFLYYQFKINNYIIPPGDDPVNHYEIASNILAGKFSLSYPFLFHYLIGLISKLQGIDLMAAFVQFTPVLIILPSIAIFVFAWMNFGRLAAVISFAVALLASNYGLIGYADGNYPNILSAGFFMILALSFLLKIAVKGGKLNYLFFSLFTLLTLITHHLSTFYLAVILVCLLIVLTVWNKIYKDVEGYRQMIKFFLTATIIAVLVVALTPLRVPLLIYIKSLYSTRVALENAFYFSKILDFSDYGSLSGELVLSGGLFAMLYIASCLFSKKYDKHVKVPLIFLMVWFLSIFLFSRFSFVGLPGRFARELAPPLIIAIGFFISDTSRVINSALKRVVYFSIFILILLVNLTQINAGPYRSPEFFNKMIRFAQSDKDDAAEIASFTVNKDVILANPTTPFLPIVSGRKIVFLKKTDVVSREQIAISVKHFEATHVFVGTSTWTKPDPIAYPFFKDFDVISDDMNKAMSKSTCPFQEFSSGSKLYEITEKCLKNLTK